MIENLKLRIKVKARQKNKQAEKYEFIFKINKECRALPIPQKLIDKMKEIMKLAQDNGL